jgi:hypothetical protein
MPASDSKRLPDSHAQIEQHRNDAVWNYNMRFGHELIRYDAPGGTISLQYKDTQQK